jgi:acetyl-CoA acetyltransferase
MSTRYPVKDKVAIVGVGTTGFGRDLGATTQRALAATAITRAVKDAGLSAKDIDGIVGPPNLLPEVVQDQVGFPELTWWGISTSPVQSFRVTDAMNAVFSGQCETAVVYQAIYRGPGNSRSLQDPFRARAAGMGSGPVTPYYMPFPNQQYYMPYNGLNWGSYWGWMARYMYEYGATREDFGLISINGRTNAAHNDLAVLRKPITMKDYLDARLVREPMCLLDMDIPVDGADALVITTAERAKDLTNKPVYIHAASYGQVPETQDDLMRGLGCHGQQVAAKALWDRSDIKLADVDLFYPFDGFSIFAMTWIENIGYCKPGEGGDFLRQHWDPVENRVKVDGRVVFNSHGGALNEGATQGSGHIREAVQQLRGDAGPRQVDGAKTALLTPGGWFHNATTLMLRAE